jgi:hypothetical protein
MILYNYLNNINNNSIENLEIFEHTILEDYKKEIKINDDYNICFVISCKYNRNYVTYIKYYVDNIIKYYTNYLIIIIDNNSIYIDEIITLFNFLNYKNIIILTNNIECKFEIGAYKMGIIYLFKNDLIDKYDYYVFTQDNFVFKNKYDFNIFKNNNIYASPIIYLTLYSGYENDHPWLINTTSEIIKQLNLIEDSYNIIHGCWCHSFILHKSKIIDFYNITKNIIIKDRAYSVCSEFYLPNILLQLNNNKLFTIDGYSDFYNGIHHNIKYDIYSKYINIDSHYFEKKFQGKTENTIENF